MFTIACSIPDDNNLMFS